MNGVDIHNYDYFALAGTGKYAAVQYHYNQNDYSKISILTNNDDSGKLANTNIRNLLKETPVEIAESYPHENDWNLELKYIINHGYRTNYIRASKDQLEAIESRLDALMQPDQSDVKAGLLEFTHNFMLENNLPNMDLYIMDYIESARSNYPGETFQSLMSRERSAGKDPSKIILEKYNRKQLKHRPEIIKQPPINQDMNVCL